jgi:hypothetical protein
MPLFRGRIHRPTTARLSRLPGGAVSHRFLGEDHRLDTVAQVELHQDTDSASWQAIGPHAEHARRIVTAEGTFLALARVLGGLSPTLALTSVLGAARLTGREALAEL